MRNYLDKFFSDFILTFVIFDVKKTEKLRSFMNIIRERLGVAIGEVEATNYCMYLYLKWSVNLVLKGQEKSGNFKFQSPHEP